ncbi:MAG TPA: Gfo/Idh/MocA family oxidoreductase [bacterium]|nr:Gfo/Idh/MocA family oxidoreductase [bacterium]
MQKSDGMNYAPVSQARPEPVCGAGEFMFAVIGLDHGHIYAMCNGLVEAGATLTKVYDKDASKVAAFVQRYPQAIVAKREDDILNDSSCRLIASAIRPCDRAALGIRVMESGKHFFVDKPGMLTFDELELAKAACARTGRKYAIYFGERLHVEGAVFAGQLIQQGAIGRVVHVTILAPHRLNKASRPDWFFEKDQNGGIITDLGSHQVEQFLAYSGARSIRVMHSTLANYANKDKPNFYDYGDGNLLADNGATCYFRVDWFTPDGLGAWGDGRVFIIGTTGTIEIRKYIDVACSPDGDHVYVVDKVGEHKYEVTGKVGFVFFGKFIRDCFDGTETAISQEHTFEAMRATLMAQAAADILG